MKAEDFNAAMAMYADADQQATATLIEIMVAAVIVKLAPPSKGAVASVTISPQDVSDMMTTHYVEGRYVGDEMTVFVTPMEITSEAS